MEDVRRQRWGSLLPLLLLLLAQLLALTAVLHGCSGSCLLLLLLQMLLAVAAVLYGCRGSHLQLLLLLLLLLRRLLLLLLLLVLQLWRWRRPAPRLPAAALQQLLDNYTQPATGT